MRKFKILLILLIISGISVHTHSATRKPAAGTKGMVVSSEPIAADIGLRVLKEGGNAIDAAIAVGAVLNVTEGYNFGMGGGCFIVVYWAETGEVTAIDGRERAPLKADRDLYIDKNDQVIPGLSTEGATASGTPGIPAAFHLAHQKWSSKSWNELFTPAIALADTGFDISRTYWEYLLFSKDRLYQYPSSREIFFPENDTLPYSFGSRLVQKDLSRFLDSLAANGASWFYGGNFAKDIVKFIKKSKGYLTENDFQMYSAIERKPIMGSFRGYDIYSMPPPSSGGVHVIQILEMLEPFQLSYIGAGSSESIHLLAETMKRAFADRAYYLGDPDFVKVPVDALLDSSYLARHRSLIKPYEATNIKGPGELPLNEGTQTTHYSIIDSAGNMVAVTATLNTSFGSALVVPGYGLLLNNQMDDFSVQPGVPNYYGLIGSEANAIEGGKRPLSSMTPAIVLKDGKPAGVFGSPGGPRIITTVLQVMLNIIEYGMDVQEAVDFPRVHHQWKPDYLFLEAQIPYDVIVNLKLKGHQVYQYGEWSSAQCIWIDRETGLITGGTDSRSEGKAAGW